MLKTYMGALVAILLVSAASADEFPIDALQDYGDFREKMLAMGWEPVPTRAALDAHPPEVSCGNSMCGAEWMSPSGRAFNIGLWFRAPYPALVVAPQGGFHDEAR